MVRLHCLIYGRASEFLQRHYIYDVVDPNTKFRRPFLKWLFPINHAVLRQRPFRFTMTAENLRIDACYTNVGTKLYESKTKQNKKRK